MCLFSDLKAEENSLPLVVESMDIVIVVKTEKVDHQRIIFIRNNRVIATRLLVDDMIWTTVGDKFQLIWQDYWTAERVIEFDNLYSVVVQETPTKDEDLPWWAMRRVMVDLKAP